MKKYDKYEMMQRLDVFRKKVKNDGNTVDSFNTIDKLKYIASSSFTKAVAYADENAGWVRYRDVVNIVNEEIAEHNRVNAETNNQQQIMFDDMKKMLNEFEDRIASVENQQTWGEIPNATNDYINNLFHVEGNNLVIGNQSQPNTGKDNVDTIPIDSALLLVYAASGDGQILRMRTLGSPICVSTAGKRFMSENTNRESARWQEALDRLIERGWVKTVGYKGQIYELTNMGYNNADWLKDELGINTDNDPIDELRKFEKNEY